MATLDQPGLTKRYDAVTQEKADGVTYTPKILADFIARQVVQTAETLPADRPLRILDPAVGHGQLLLSLLERLADQPNLMIEAFGFETNTEALDSARRSITQQFPSVSLHFEPTNFLDFVLEQWGDGENGNLFCRTVPEAYDLIIANPPYVRTQVMGTTRARLLSRRFGLSGRVDLYYAFILGISQVLAPRGLAGIVVSNRFMTTKSGASVRRVLLQRFHISHIWDLGDTKLFDAAVLPAVLVAEGTHGGKAPSPEFTSIYQTSAPAHERMTDPLSALDREGVIELADGRHFQVQHGRLDTNGAADGVWRLTTQAIDTWLATVEARTWGTFRDIGKIRVGVKTCADKVFIRKDWQDMSKAERPELLKPLATHHLARRFKPLIPDRQNSILYPHEVVQGRRQAVVLAKYPRSRAYLETHRATLEGRQYLIEAGREWYEIWVPQDPEAWTDPKLVFRDIAQEPTFWIDQEGSVVNGDCYWLTCQDSVPTDLLWLAAAVGNSTFIEHFYDHCFHNKLYAGRRRFITQYVERFPLPDPYSEPGRAIVAKAKHLYRCIPSPEAHGLQKELDAMVWEAFGLRLEKVSR
ncbi:MAG: N-6 DNA methylase [Desulfurellaceae bacterium]|nr:N-6 DNA methylase [Desulfurellaceae bacterium]